MAKLLDLITNIDQLDREDVICAKPEWHPDSEARVFRLTEDCRVPDEATSLGYKYFLEVDIIRQVLEEFRSRPDASINEKCERIIHYATYDA
ncbi:hypothetical protein WMF38_30015 [Sorangium sp. So ce118]|uniref:DUF7716 domain-containing protein n=1 Tax=Sorangium cellulosum TaxID=56 RepID=A0A150QXB5_SORCE|nr:hypothetical protein BE17_50620 [Sorangium cellulosum]